jgi:hypothetical protein
LSKLVLSEDPQLAQAIAMLAWDLATWRFYIGITSAAFLAFL